MFIDQVSRVAAPLLLQLATLLRLVTFSQSIDQSKVHNRTNVLIDAARKRGITIEVLQIGRFQSRFFRATFRSQSIVFDRIPHGNAYHRVSVAVADDKWQTKAYLLQAGMPAPDGSVVKTIRGALAVARSLQWPVVVKPVDGSLAQGVTCAITNEDQLIQAVAIAQRINRRVVVERHLTGNTFRILVVGERMVGALRRMRPHVVGDGHHTIRSLVAQKNTDPRRGAREQRNTTLHTIQLDRVAEAHLQTQGFTIESVPDVGATAILHPHVTARYGGDTTDVTAEVHPENQALFLQIARRFDATILGIDCVAQTLNQPLDPSSDGIVEVNTYPYLDLHHVPTWGTPRDAAGAVWDCIVPGSRA